MPSLSYPCAMGSHKQPKDPGLIIISLAATLDFFHSVQFCLPASPVLSGAYSLSSTEPPSSHSLLWMFSSPVFWFSAPVVNYCKAVVICSLNSQVQKSKISITGLVLKCSWGCVPSRGFREECTPCLLKLLVTAGIAWLVTSLQTSREAIFKSLSDPSSCHYLWVSFLLCCLSYKDTCDWLHSGPTWITRDTLPILKILNLITFAKTLFPNKVTITGSRDYELVPLEAIIQATTICFLYLKPDSSPRICFFFRTLQRQQVFCFYVCLYCF